MCDVADEVNEFLHKLDLHAYHTGVGAPTPAEVAVYAGAALSELECGGDGGLISAATSDVLGLRHESDFNSESAVGRQLHRSLTSVGVIAVLGKSWAEFLATQVTQNMNMCMCICVFVYLVYLVY